MADPSMRSILAATDLSPACDPVLRAAGALARTTGAALHVIHALDFPPSPYLDARRDSDSFPGLLHAARDTLDGQLDRTLPAGIRAASARVEIYAAHRAVAQYARAVMADLVVIGPHTHEGLEAGVLGSTADRLIRTLEVPCLVLRGELMLPLRRVLVPVDLSRAARPALEVAVRWSRALGHPHAAGRRTDVVALHVVPRLAGAPDPRFQRVVVEPGLGAELESALGGAGAPPNVTVREEVLWGDRPADEIVGYARREWMDLVVLATHGHGALVRALIGSTASSVARRAPCPVLLVPPRLWREPPRGVHQPGEAAHDSRPIAA